MGNNNRNNNMVSAPSHIFRRTCRCGGDGTRARSLAAHGNHTISRRIGIGRATPISFLVFWLAFLDLLALWHYALERIVP